MSPLGVVQSTNADRSSLCKITVMFSRQEALFVIGDPVGEIVVVTSPASTQRKKLNI